MMDDLDALLAELQNTVSPDTSLIAGGNNSSTPGYGSLNGTRGPPPPVHQHYHHQQQQQQQQYSASPQQQQLTSSPYRHYENRSTTPLQSQSPTYQNREAIEEFRSGGGYGGAVNQSGSAGSKMPSLNNNLSELDTLLQDLSNAHYNNSYTPERDLRSMNGGTTSPMLRSGSSLSAGRGPTVDSLLEELSSGMPNGDYPQQVQVTLEERTTEILPADDYYNPPSQQGSLNRREMERSYNATAATSNGHTASNATRELDDLMASLSEFKINGGSGSSQLRQAASVVDSAYARPSSNKQQSHSPSLLLHQYESQPTSSRIQITETTRTQSTTSPGQLPYHQHQQYESYTQTAQSVTHIKQNQLDSMLGNLQADMSRQGVNTTQKGCCSACEKPIVGQVITALGKTWHPEHFTCTHCREELGTRNFFEREGHPYCEPDYHNLFSPRCAYCNGPILDKCVTALDKTWHTEHFFCAQCGKQFGEEGFHERDGKPYCRDDYFDMFAPKCGGCNRAIMENYISALNAQWHPDCFVCRDCKKPVSGKSFYAMEGKPLCPKCVGVDEEEVEEEEEEA